MYFTIFLILCIQILLNLILLELHFKLLLYQKYLTLAINYIITPRMVQQRLKPSLFVEISRKNNIPTTTTNDNLKAFFTIIFYICNLKHSLYRLNIYNQFLNFYFKNIKLIYRLFSKFLQKMILLNILFKTTKEINCSPIHAIIY